MENKQHFTVGETVSLSPFRFEKVGDTLQGRIAERRERDIQGRSFGQYVVEDFDGNQWRVYGNVSLDDAFSRVADGEYIQIVLASFEESPSGYPTKVFKVSRLIEA
jgi:hypothetical protein